MHESILIVSDEKLQEIQIEELKARYNVYHWEEIPVQLSRLWNGINPVGQLDTHKFRELREYILKKKQDGYRYIYIKGDRGAEFYLISYAFVIGMQPLYSSTYKAVQVDGQCQRLEEQHVFFRKYVPFELR